MSLVAVRGSAGAMAAALERQALLSGMLSGPQDGTHRKETPAACCCVTTVAAMVNLLDCVLAPGAVRRGGWCCTGRRSPRRLRTGSATRKRERSVLCAGCARCKRHIRT